MTTSAADFNRRNCEKFLANPGVHPINGVPMSPKSKAYKALVVNCGPPKSIPRAPSPNMRVVLTTTAKSGKILVPRALPISREPPPLPRIPEGGLPPIRRGPPPLPPIPEGGLPPIRRNVPVAPLPSIPREGIRPLTRNAPTLPPIPQGGFPSIRRSPSPRVLTNEGGGREDSIASLGQQATVRSRIPRWGYSAPENYNSTVGSTMSPNALDRRDALWDSEIGMPTPANSTRSNTKSTTPSNSTRTNSTATATSTSYKSFATTPSNSPRTNSTATSYKSFATTPSNSPRTNSTATSPATSYKSFESRDVTPRDIIQESGRYSAGGMQALRPRIPRAGYSAPEVYDSESPVTPRSPPVRLPAIKTPSSPLSPQLQSLPIGGSPAVPVGSYRNSPIYSPLSPSSYSSASYSADNEYSPERNLRGPIGYGLSSTNSSQDYYADGESSSPVSGPLM